VTQKIFGIFFWGQNLSNPSLPTGLLAAEQFDAPAKSISENLP